MKPLIHRTIRSAAAARPAGPKNSRGRLAGGHDAGGGANPHPGADRKILVMGGIPFGQAGGTNFLKLHTIA